MTDEDESELGPPPMEMLVQCNEAWIDFEASMHDNEEEEAFIAAIRGTADMVIEMFKHHGLPPLSVDSLYGLMIGKQLTEIGRNLDKSMNPMGATAAIADMLMGASGMPKTPFCELVVGCLAADIMAGRI